MLDKSSVALVRHPGDQVDIRCLEEDRLIYRRGQIVDCFLDEAKELRYLIQLSDGQELTRPYNQVPGSDEYLKKGALKTLEALHLALLQQVEARPKMVFPEALCRILEEIRRCRILIQKVEESAF